MGALHRRLHERRGREQQNTVTATNMSTDVITMEVITYPQRKEHRGLACVQLQRAAHLTSEQKGNLARRKRRLRTEQAQGITLLAQQKKLLSAVEEEELAALQGGMIPGPIT